MIQILNYLLRGSIIERLGLKITKPGEGERENPCPVHNHISSRTKLEVYKTLSKEMYKEFEHISRRLANIIPETPLIATS